MIVVFSIFFVAVVGLGAGCFFFVHSSVFGLAIIAIFVIFMELHWWLGRDRRPCNGGGWQVIWMHFVFILGGG